MYIFKYVYRLIKNKLKNNGHIFLQIRLYYVDLNIEDVMTES